MNFDEVVTKRFSARAFKRTAVPRSLISRILEHASQAPSWCNIQPWRVRVLSSTETSKFAQGLYEWAESSERVFDFRPASSYKGVYRERQVDAGMRLYGALGIERNDAERRREQLNENYRLFGAPHVALVFCDSRLGDYPLVDVGIYLSHFVLSATRHGVATIVQGALSGCGSFIRDYFDLEEHNKVVAGISFGFVDSYASINQFRTPRADIVDTATLVGWDRESECASE